MTADRNPWPKLASLDFRALSDCAAKLGESPVWDEDSQMVWWVDIDGCAVLRSDPSGQTHRWPTPEIPGFVVLDRAGLPFVGMESGIFAFCPDTARFDLLVPLPRSGMRFNDACVDGLGRLWAGTIDVTIRQDNGVLYRVTSDGGLHAVAAGFRIINGLAWDEGAARLYVSDSHETVRRIWSLSRDGGARVDFARFGCGDGRPDGAAVDAQGRYWIAGVDGGQLHCFDRDGRRHASQAVPVPKPTKPVFGGPGLSQMFLTSKGGADPAGRLLVCDLPPGVRGQGASRWARV